MYGEKPTLLYKSLIQLTKVLSKNMHTWGRDDHPTELMDRQNQRVDPRIRSGAGDCLTVISYLVYGEQGYVSALTLLEYA